MKGPRVLTVVALVCFVAVTDAYSQNNRQPRPLATPPVLTGAEIIRGGSFEDPQEEVKQTGTAQPRTAPTPTNTERLAELLERVKRLESQKTSTSSAGDEKQKALLMNLDIITRAEQRSDSLRKQLFEMIEKENTIKTRLEQIEYDARPDVVERSVQIAGSMRPEEVREARRRSLAAEKTNLQVLLTEIQSTRGNLAAALQRADMMVEKLRFKLEKDIDDALEDDKP
ncbi:MAG: hypothetical protein IPM50_02340 [Acidobacteriota bacterium]|nr:MAG: hypothetical protein IPM50_02340 [Acidobacteriota bacterium]